MSTARLVLVDDHPVLLQGLGTLLSADNSFSVVASGKSALDAVEISRRMRPDVMVMDINMPGNAFEAISTITNYLPDTRIVAFTAATETEIAVRALEAGASGYVVKGSTIDELKDAIVAVMQGETYVSQEVAFKVITALRGTPKREGVKPVRLSVREGQVVKLLLLGKTNREIATELGIGERTVKHYMTVLMQKLEVRNRLEVVIAAQHLALTTGPDAGVYVN